MNKIKTTLLLLSTLLVSGLAVSPVPILAAPVECPQGYEYEDINGSNYCKKTETWEDAANKLYYIVTNHCEYGTSNCHSEVQKCEVTATTKTSNCQETKYNQATDIETYKSSSTDDDINCELPGNKDTCQCGNTSACLSGGVSGQIINVLKIGLTVLSGAVGVAAVIMLIVGGIQYSASNGDSGGVKAAKDKITNVLIGLLAYVFLYAFLQWLIPGGILP